MLKKEYPEEGELVVGTVVKVQDFGAFVALDEYPNKEGFIHISEIASGWVKRIRNFIRENQKIVCRVMQVNPSKKHIDLSLKRVNDHQRREKIQEWKNAQKASKLFEMFSSCVGKSPDECYQEFGQELEKKYGSLYTAFEECAYDTNTLKNDGFDCTWLKEFEKVAKDNIAIPFVEIKGMLYISTWMPNGIQYIKKALTVAEQSAFEDVQITIQYISAPRYLISVRAPDYKIAEDQMKKAVQRAFDYMKQYKAECDFKREIEE